MNKIYATLLALLTAHKTEVDAAIEQNPSGPLAPEYKALRDQVAAELAKLPTAEKAAAETDWTWAVDAMRRGWEACQEGLRKVTAKHDALLAANGVAVSESNGLREKMAGGKMIAREEHDTLLVAAQTRTAQEKDAEMAVARGKIVELCGLPAAPAAILALPLAAEFNARVEAARDNLGDMAARGIKREGGTEKLALRLAWLPKAEYDGYMEEHKEFMPKKPAAAAGGRGLGDPMHQLAGAGGTSKRHLVV